MHSRFMVIAVALVFASCVCMEDARAQNARFSKYKREMMPKVGTRVSVVGILKSGKLGWFLETDGWGIYIYATNDSGLARENNLDRLFGRRVRATGTLQYRPGSYPERADVAGVPEHFCFDESEVEVIAVRHRRKGSRTARLQWADLY
jgi:hypothetical protein